MVTSATAVAEQPMLIDGEWVPAADGQWSDVISPGRRGSTLARVPVGTSVDADRAVAAARAAQPRWAATHFKVRQKALLRAADALEAGAEDLAQLTAADTGNALRTQARPESQVLVDLFRYFGGVAGEFKGVVLPAGADQLQYTRREPLGVVAGILPWNSPLMIAGMKTPASLAAGNTLVLKTAQEAPLSVLRMAEIVNEFLPPGVLNVVTGAGRDIGEALLRHPGVDKVSFTGSTDVGRHVGEVTGKRLAHVSLELGGKSPTLVFPDSATADTIDDTVAAVLTAMRFTRQGQSCTAGSRLFVHADVYDTFLAALVERVGALKVGDPLDESSDMGSIISQKQSTPSAVISLTGSPRTASRWPWTVPISPIRSWMVSTRPRQSWPASETTGGSPRKRSSGPSWWPFRGGIATRSFVRPTTVISVSALTCSVEI